MKLKLLGDRVRDARPNLADLRVDVDFPKRLAGQRRGDVPILDTGPPKWRVDVCYMSVVQ